MAIYINAYHKSIGFLLIFFFFSCQKENSDVRQNKYYIEGTITNGSPLLINIYKMAPLQYDSTTSYDPYYGYFNKGLKIGRPIHLKLSDDKGNYADTSIQSADDDYLNIWRNALVGQPKTWYNLTVTIGKETLQTDFYVPDTFSFDSYKLDSLENSEALFLGINYPQSYIAEDTMCFLPIRWSYSGFDVIYDFCKIESAVFITDLIEGKYLDWYTYTTCKQKRFFDQADNYARMRYFIFFFKPNSGSPIYAVDSKTFRYIKQLNNHVYKNINGITYPTAFPSQFNSDVFYGGIITYTNKNALFKKH